jgi:hypothetical protein
MKEDEDKQDQKGTYEVKNQPFDLAVDIDESNNNSIATNEQEEDREEATALIGKKNMDSDFKNSTLERKQQMDGDEDEDENNF